MALDIVTSYQGFDHITADQLADFQRGLLGDSCILPVGSKMEVNIQTANQITVADGVVVYDGREIHIPYGTSENVAITSGTQGMMRNDIVCLQYNRDESSGVESVEFVTIAGTPAASDPQDPAYSNLDIRTGVFMSQKPFCRVRLNGTGNTDSNTIFVLPEGFRPSKTEYCECQGSAKATWFLDITTGGEVRMSRYGAGSFQTAEVDCWLPFSHNFLVD